jgi:hypothetical protein
MSVQSLEPKLFPSPPQLKRASLIITFQLLLLQRVPDAGSMGDGSAGDARCALSPTGDGLRVRRPWRATQGVLTGRAAALTGCGVSDVCVSRGRSGCARDDEKSASDSATLAMGVWRVEVVMEEVMRRNGERVSKCVRRQRLPMCHASLLPDSATRMGERPEWNAKRVFALLSCLPCIKAQARLCRSRSWSLASDRRPTEPTFAWREV